MTTSASAMDRAIGAALRTVRMRQGMTQDELARALGIDRSTVAKYESGARSMTVVVLLQIAAVLRVPLAALLPDMAADGGSPSGA